MRIDAVRLHRIHLPLVRPFRTSFGTETVRDVLLVEVVPDVGPSGWGECVAMSWPGYSSEYVDASVDVLADHVVPAMWRLGDGVTAETLRVALRTLRGHPMSRAALETAVLDAELRRDGVSLAAHLGAVRDRVDCGVSVGIPPSERLGDLLDEVAGYVDAGYRRIKLKIQPGWDVDPVRAVRATWPDVPLQVDANQAYTRDDSATLAGLDPFDLLLVEQPLPEDDLLGHAMLAQRIETPVCLDESVLSVASAESAIAFGAAEIVNIKPGRVGGYLEARDIHDLCQARGVPVWAGGMLETGVGRAANVALAALPGFTLPGDTSASDRYYAVDVTEPFVLRDGTLEVPTAPGIGVDPVLAILAELTVWSGELRASV